MRAKVAVSKAAQGRAHRVLRHGGKYVFTQWAKDDDLLRIVSISNGSQTAPMRCLN
jgi:hypothetical protein